MLVHIIDDDQAMARTVARTLKQAGWENTLYESAERFLEDLDQLPFGCVISDLKMPRISGVELIEALHERRPEWPVIILTAYGELDAAVRSFRHGAIHFLQKPFKRPELISALEEAYEIGLRRLGESERQSRTECLKTLSKREVEILSALARGLQSKVIAWELGISIRTVEVHRSNILAKLGVRNTTQAVGLLQLSQPDIPPA